MRAGHKLVKIRLLAWISPTGLVLSVDTDPQPSWNVYRGKGQWSCSDREVRAAYLEAADSGTFSIMKRVRKSFPDIADEDVTIEFL